MPGKIKPEKRPLPLKTRQIFNTRGSILNAMLPVSATQAKAIKLPSLVRKTVTKKKTGTARRGGR
jgi:hypothetical protein